MNAHSSQILTYIFQCHEELQKLNIGTIQFGFGWSPQEGIILCPDNTIAQYYSSTLAIHYPELPVRTLDWETSPAEIKTLSSLFPNALVVLCEMQSYLDHDIGHEYARLIKMLPPKWVGRTITARQIGDFLPAGDRTTKLRDYYRKTDYPAEKANRKKIEKVFSLFGDSLSQATFIAILKRHLLRADALVPLAKGPLYFEKTLNLNEEEVVVDCGAFQGDTLAEYMEYVSPTFKSYHAFEPDPANFAALEKQVKEMEPTSREKVHLWPKAVGHTIAKLPFRGGGGDGALESCVDNSLGDSKVESIPLDIALKDKHPTFIKMDLEGYEAFALLGAKELIRNDRPVLAICVYHHPFDLWELPLLVASFARGYRYFLRAYNEMFDYVCYCVPEERIENKEDFRTR